MGSVESGADSAEFWNEVWDTADPSEASHDGLLESIASGLAPGRALDIGCGASGNAIWLAERGWQVAGLDFSEVAVEKGRKMAASRGLDVEFIVADASTYRPDTLCRLITSFYIQLPPAQRRQMLSNAANALAPGGRLVFVSHDKSSPPSGWDTDELDTLTTPDEVAAELPDLVIERAEVIEVTGAHMTHMPTPDKEHAHKGHEHHPPEHSEAAKLDSHGGSTVVVARKPIV